MRRFLSTILLASVLGCTNGVDVYRGKHIESGKGEADIELKINRKTLFTTAAIRMASGEIYGEDIEGDGRYEKIQVYKNGILVNQYPLDPNVELEGSRELPPYLLVSSATWLLNEGKKETLAQNGVSQ